MHKYTFSLTHFLADSLKPKYLSLDLFGHTLIDTDATQQPITAPGECQFPLMSQLGNQPLKIWTQEQIVSQGKRIY